MKTPKISVRNVSQESPLPHNWTYIGYDECNYTTTPDGMSLLRDFASLEAGPYYVRTHHLFCTGNCGAGFYKWGSTNLYHEDEAGNPIYDFTVIDKIMQTLLDCGVKPFMELGFMPMDLVEPSRFGTDDPYSKYNHYQRELWATPPKDYQKWHDLIAALTKHLISRFGEEEVSTWLFELWNEPDIFYWAGTEEEFFRLYDETEAAMHSCCPSLRLGGPATTGPVRGMDRALYLLHFLEHTSQGTNYHTGEKGTRLDFVTFHTKGGGLFFNPWDKKSTPSVSFLVEQVRYGLEMIRQTGYADLPIILSEADPDGWAAGGVGDNPNMNFRNTEYYASFIVSSYLELIHLAKDENIDLRPIAWAFLFPGERCFEGTRTFTTRGIHKASFAAMQAFSHMGTAMYTPELTDIPASVRVLASRCNQEHQLMICRHEDDWDLKNCLGIDIELPIGSDVQAYLIDSTHSNPYAQWVALGSPDYPDPEIYEKIRSCEGLEKIPAVFSENGSVHFDLEANSVLLLTFSY